MARGEKEDVDSINAAIKWGKLDIRVIPLLEEAQIIEVTGWTPEEFERQDVTKIRALMAIWSSKSVMTRREKKEFGGIG